MLLMQNLREAADAKRPTKETRKQAKPLGNTKIKSTTLFIPLTKAPFAKQYPRFCRA